MVSESSPGFERKHLKGTLFELRSADQTEPEIFLSRADMLKYDEGPDGPHADELTAAQNASFIASGKILPGYIKGGDL